MRLLSINRNFYFFGIFFAVLYLFLSVFQSVLYLQLGIKTKYLHSFPIWFLILNIVAFIGLFILLKYYYYKKYWAALIAIIPFIGASFCHEVVVYFMLTEQRLESHFIGTYNVLLLASICFGLSLLLSGARKRIWLRVAGVSLLILGLALTITFHGSLNAQDFELRGILDKVHNGISMLGSLLSLPFLLNFREELRTLNTTNEKQPLSKMVKLSLLALTIFALIPSMNLTRDGIGNVLTKKEPSERAKLLAHPFEAHTFVNKEGQSLSYRLLRPLNYNPQKKYPLAVCLHHGGGNGTENVIQIETSELAQSLSKPENREKYPAFIFVPQCPPGSSFGGIPNYPKIDDLVFEAMADLEAEFSINEKRRYVMGVSLGGFGSWNFIGSRPQLFAAAMPICGGGNPNHAKNMVDIPIWAFHGEIDTNVPVKLSRKMIDAIRKAGGNPRYIEFANKGHNIWGMVDETPGKLEWLFAQQRD